MAFSRVVNLIWRRLMIHKVSKGIDDSTAATAEARKTPEDLIRPTPDAARQTSFVQLEDVGRGDQIVWPQILSLRARFAAGTGCQAKETLI